MTVYTKFLTPSYPDTPIGRRKSLADAAGSGLFIVEWKPKDSKATAEIMNLFNAVFELK